MYREAAGGGGDAPPLSSAAREAYTGKDSPPVGWVNKGTVGICFGSILAKGIGGGGSCVEDRAGGIPAGGY